VFISDGARVIFRQTSSENNRLRTLQAFWQVYWQWSDRKSRRPSDWVSIEAEGHDLATAG